MEEKTSRISGFYKKPVEERLEIVKDFCGLKDEEVKVLEEYGPMGKEVADRLIENVIGVIDIPLAVAVNFKINNQEYLVPMATEESSVVAAASYGAKMAREGEGIQTTNTGPNMIAQIQAVNVDDPYGARLKILNNKEELLELANKQDPVLIDVGGGARDLEVRIIDSQLGPMVVTHLIVDTRDAMGANAVNTMAEALAPTVAAITNGEVHLRILSNLADKRLVRAYTKVSTDVLDEEVIDGIITAYAFAEADPYRAATHNKGIMNGISAAILATGNDFRAIESGAHAYASRSGQYSPLTTWEKDKDGNLVGTLEMPMAVGLIGGATANHPIAELALKILGVESSTELGEVVGALGLAQNLAALRALATEGIQKGHMSLHAKNVAAMAGAEGKEIDRIAEIMVKEGKVNANRAQELLEESS